MEELIQSMRVVLGTSFTLYLKTHGYHWNVEGSDFPQLHELFKGQYEEIWASIDETAERIRMLDAYAPGSMARFIKLSKVAEDVNPTAPTAEEMVLALVADHETMRIVLEDAFAAAEKAGQQDIMDYLAGRMDAHAKHRWMLRATAKRREA